MTGSSIRSTGRETGVATSFAINGSEAQEGKNIPPKHCSESKLLHRGRSRFDSLEMVH